MVNICNANYSSAYVLNKKQQAAIFNHSKLIDFRTNNENLSASLKVKKQVNFTGVSEKIGTCTAKAFSPNFINSKGMYSAANIAANGVLLQSCIVLFINTLPRPAAIMATPGPKIEDRRYAAVKSIASGICDFVITGGLFYFIKKGLDKWSKHPDCVINKWSKSASAKDGLKKSGTELINWGLKYAIGIPQAFLMFALIPPIVKIVFPNKGKKPETKVDSPKTGGNS